MTAVLDTRALFVATAAVSSHFHLMLQWESLLGATYALHQLCGDWSTLGELRGLREALVHVEIEIRVAIVGGDGDGEDGRKQHGGKLHLGIWLIVRGWGEGREGEMGAIKLGLPQCRPSRIPREYYVLFLGRSEEQRW